MRKSKGLLICLVLGCVGALFAVMVAGGAPPTGVLADATVPPPTIPAAVHLPLVYKPLIPGIYVRNVYWVQAPSANVWIPTVLYAEIVNRSGQRVRIEQVMAVFLDAAGDAIDSFTAAPGAAIWILDDGMASPLAVDIFGSTYDSGERSLPSEPRHVRFDVSWEPTGDSAVYPAVTEVKSCCYCYYPPWDCVCDLSGRIHNTARERIRVVHLMYPWLNPLDGKRQWYRHPRFHIVDVLPGSSWTEPGREGRECADKEGVEGWAFAFSDVTQAGPTFMSRPISPQYGVFSVEFIALPPPAGGTTNGVISLSEGPATTFTDMALSVRFYDSYIDARDGGQYRADVTMRHAYGIPYHFRLVVDVQAHTYSVYVTEFESYGQRREIPLATDYAFRTNQGRVTHFDYWNVWSAEHPVYVYDWHLPAETE